MFFRKLPCNVAIEIGNRLQKTQDKHAFMKAYSGIYSLSYQKVFRLSRDSLVFKETQSVNGR